MEVEPLPQGLTNEGLACWLQEKKVAIEEAHQGLAIATLEVVEKAARPFTWHQMEGLEGLLYRQAGFLL